MLKGILRTVLLLVVIHLLNACATATDHYDGEGGIGGTGNTEDCANDPTENNQNCNANQSTEKI